MVHQECYPRVEVKGRGVGQGAKAWWSVSQMAPNEPRLLEFRILSPTKQD